MITLEPIKNINIILREFELNDAQDFYNNWGKDPDVAKYMLWKTHTNIDDAVKSIEKFIECYKNDDPFKQYAIVYDKQVVGSISILISKKHCTGEIAYCLGKKYWHKGIMSDAINLLINYYFKSYNLVRISAEVITKNITSKKLLEKCGFELEGILRKKYFCKTNEHENVYSYSIIK